MVEREERGPGRDHSGGDEDLPAELLPARLLRAERAAEGQVRLQVEPPEGFLDRHERAGQHCPLVLAQGLRALPFALLSAPGEGRLEFLVRLRGGGAAAAHLRPGDRVLVGPPAGRGFALERVGGRDVCFVASGTGLAPIRAAARVTVEGRVSHAALRLYHGSRGPSWVALGEELRALEEGGVDVRAVYSRELAGLPGRFVQDAVVRDAPDPSTTAFVVAGHRELLDAMRAYAGRHERPLGLVLTNF